MLKDSSRRGLFVCYDECMANDKKKHIVPVVSKNVRKWAFVRDVRLVSTKNKLLLVVVILVLWFVLSWLNYTVTQTIHNTQAKNYLEHKYGKHFVVKTNPHPTRVIGDSPTYHGIAYEVTAPDRKIYITRPASFLDFTQQFNDTYVGVAWSRYPQEAIKNDVTAIFGSTPDYRVEVGLASDSLMKLYDGKIALSDFNDALRRYPEDVQVGLTVKVHDSTPKAEQDKLFKVANYMKEKYPGRVYVRYVILIGDAKLQTNRTVCNLSGKSLLNLPAQDQLYRCFVNLKGWE